MLPRLKKSRNSITYDARLLPKELDILRMLLGCSIQSIHLEYADLVIDPIHVGVRGRCALRFQPEKRQVVFFIFKSLLEDRNLPIIQQGGLFFQKLQADYSAEHLDNVIEPRPSLSESFTCTIQYPNRSEVQSISIYGESFTGSIKDYDSDIDLDNLNDFGFSDYPHLDLQSIEFIVFKHRNGLSFILSLDEGGFWLNFEQSEPVVERAEAFYLKVNGATKNIHRHHFIE